jgi:cell cycle arrest protein BUB2
MSLIASPFLFIMNEVDSFYAYKRLMTRICPTYFTHEMVGTYAGCALVDEIIQIIDPQLHAICPESRSWAFKYISSFLTNQKPLREVLKLWVRQCSVN